MMNRKGRKAIGDYSIARRAAEEIMRRCDERGYSYKKEAESLGVNSNQLWQWKKGAYNPGAVALAQMAREGYDVNYILLGERTVRS